MKDLEAWMNAHAKALVSALVMMVFLYFTFRPDGLTAGEIEAIITGGLTAGGFTWAIPNVDKPVVATIVVAPKVDVPDVHA